MEPRYDMPRDPEAGGTLQGVVRVVASGSSMIAEETAVLDPVNRVAL